MKTKLKLMSWALFCALAAQAQNKPGGSMEAPAKSTEKPLPGITAFTQNYKKYEGYYNFYYDEKSGKVYLEISEYGKEFLYFNALPGGVGNGGPERGQAAAVITKFVKAGPKVLLYQCNYNYRGATADEQNTVDKAFAGSVLWGFLPVALEGDKVLVDITPFLIRDSQKIGDKLASGGRGGGGNTRSATPASGGAGYKVDETRSAVYLPNTRNFPLNTEFESLITFTGGSTTGAFNYGGGAPGIAPDVNAVTVYMHQSFVALPDSNYHPRKFDPRSGFNLFSYMDFSAPIDEPMVKRFSRRHRLQKKDPAAAVSEAVEPIVYYIDRGAPEPVKKALIDGGSWWNQAFEAAGYKNAFQVKELPADADAMDIRYNVVNWVDRTGSPARAFSYGSSYIDPRTGEIIKGVVTLGSDRHRQDYLIAEGLLQPYEEGKPVSSKMKELAFARLRQLSAHEIGHTLGLFHNFSSSSKERASVMDYPFPRFTLQTNGAIDVSDAYAKGIGTWDKRAIIWGYQDFPAGTNENAALDAIMKETLKQGHIFIPDVGGGAHPSSHQWDDGVDPIDELNRIMVVRRHVLDNFSEKAIVKDAPMATLEEVLVPVYLLHRYQVEAVAKSVGGLYFTHAVKNDGQVITRMVEPATQWKAFDALVNTVTPEALALPEKLISKIPPRPSGYPASIESFHGNTGPAFDPIAAAESAAATTLSYLLNEERAARLIEYHARNNNLPGFLDIVDKLLNKTWKTTPASGYHGQLQMLVNNLTLKYLLQLAANTKTAENVRSEALLEIEELKEWMTAKLPGAERTYKANLLFGLSQIEAFKQEPDKFQPVPAAEMPPGAPIGMPAMFEEDSW
ncbi:protein of unknown function [Filimonas lacunae]|uniref:Zinc-dependent metalloprotease n=1 Tax=Filimonas lacunae TaxID=477680 RepID=A0A173MLV3_9BACT|nr:zinc-dependent metalloprotease [Filimonas lacunae]BAV08449.1 hypothetical protein FLA_4490 [Filimonas lacunae]SIT33952.1 protein of unknown function [Filimonas lacunae]